MDCREEMDEDGRSGKDEFLELRRLRLRGPWFRAASSGRRREGLGM